MTFPCIQSLGAWLRGAIDFCYPPECALCRRELAAGAMLCDVCRRELSSGSGDVCRRCSAPVGPLLNTTDGCIHCRDDRFTFARVFALGAYEGQLRSACLWAKRDASGRVMGTLADLLIERWRDDLQGLAPDVVIPVPAHWTTRLLRAAAPAEAVAHRLSRFLKAPLDLHILRKSRRTRTQSSLSPTDRRQNLRQAFRVAASVQLHGAKVLLTDDVLTTGTTADRAARALRDAGAAEVFVAAMARGVGR